MNDQASWEQALAGARQSYSSLSPATAAEINGLIDDIMQFKQILVELAISAGSADICRTCGGDCCRFGKYHVSVLDIWAYLKNSAQEVIPDFSNTPACPYSDASGCTMTPGYRPMTCVIFNCQQIEDQLTSCQQESMRSYELQLREVIARAGHITGRRLDRALLLNCN